MDIGIKMLVFTADVRFPRAGREPPRRISACGISRLPLLPEKTHICSEFQHYIHLKKEYLSLLSIGTLHYLFQHF